MNSEPYTDIYRGKNVPYYESALNIFHGIANIRMEVHIDYTIQIGKKIEPDFVDGEALI